MSDCTNVNMLYYDLNNADEALRMQLLDGNGICWIKFRYIKDIVNTRVSMFRYEGLEDVIPELASRTLEMLLLVSTNLCFYKSADTGWGLYRIVNANNFGFYTRPKFVTLKPVNKDIPLQLKNVPYSDVIRIKDNTMDIPAFLPILEYINKMTYIEECLDSVLDNTTLPLVLSGPKEMINDMKAVDSKMSNKHHHRYIQDKNAVNPEIKAFSIDTQQDIDKIYDLRLKYRAEGYSSLGIYTINEKAERMLMDEVSILNDITDLTYQDAVLCRQEAIDSLNKKANMSIKLVEARKVSHDNKTDENASKIKKETEVQVKAIKDIAPEAVPSANSAFKVGGSK